MIHTPDLHLERIRLDDILHPHPLIAKHIRETEKLIAALGGELVDCSAPPVLAVQGAEFAFQIGEEDGRVGCYSVCEFQGLG